MDDRKEKNTPWLSVPQFGDWDQKGVMPDYSLDFSKIRENRKQNKRDVSRASLGNEEELISSTATTANSAHRDHQHHHFHQDHSPTVRFLAFTNQLCYMFTGSCYWLRFIGFILLGYLFISFIICILAPLNTASYMQIVVVFSYYPGSNTVLSTLIRFIVVVINLARNIIKKKILMIMGCM